jgi:cell fate (sporulation/competence/biofilm development) regulator YlbF (YheA/YmcA/DUF963 family)
MLATHESVDILDQADILTSMILQSETFAQYKSCKHRLRQNSEAQSLMHKFVKMKEQYEEVQRFGKYHPDYTKVSTEVRELKRTVDLQEDVAAFKKAERELEELLNQVGRIIADSVSKLIKVPTGNPFFDAISCSGGCGSGGSCGCS